MEEENRKRRRALRRDFNETVRELAAFVRRRDKRVAAHQAAEAERKLKHEHEQQARCAPYARNARAAGRNVAATMHLKELYLLRLKLACTLPAALQHSLYQTFACDICSQPTSGGRREQEKAERAARIREYREAEWLQQQESDTSAGSEDDSVRELEDKLYCVACEKFFKSGNALSNHERCGGPAALSTSNTYAYACTTHRGLWYCTRTSNAMHAITEVTLASIPQNMLLDDVWLCQLICRFVIPRSFVATLIVFVWLRPAF